jgi:hypothetical protein
MSRADQPGRWTACMTGVSSIDGVVPYGRTDPQAPRLERDHRVRHLGVNRRRHLLVGDPQVRGLPGRVGGDEDAHADRDLVARRRHDLQPRDLLVGEPGGAARARHRQGRRANANDDNGGEHAPAGRRDRCRADLLDPRLMGILGDEHRPVRRGDRHLEHLHQARPAHAGARVPRAERASDDHLHPGGDLRPRRPGRGGRPLRARLPERGARDQDRQLDGSRRVVVPRPPAQAASDDVGRGRGSLPPGHDRPGRTGGCG